ncbi:MAG: lysophospholipid acyltransferase family protein [Candidatus Omnitrophica bacterium]|nr:lysophospholipid acyltransferase family protein [Candidatus Omnitrophota bacterium]
MLNYVIYRFGQFIALHLPLKAAYAIAVLLADLHLALGFLDRRRVGENLRIIFPGFEPRKIRQVRRRMFRNFAKYLVDFFRFSQIDAEYIKSHIRIENLHYLNESLAEKKGVITVTAHLGNWELGGVVVAMMGYPLWGVALPHKDKIVDDFFNFQRQRKGLKVIPLGRAVRQCLAILAQNEILALVGDRDFTERGVRVNLFGKPTIFPSGPAALSLKTGAPIVPGFLFRNKDDGFTLKFEEPIHPGSAPEGAQYLAIVEKYRPIFERYIREFPDQWYMFRNFWAQ